MILIGQSIQSMSRTVKEAIENRRPELITNMAMSQAKSGADYIDLNLFSIMTETVAAMQWTVNAVQGVVDLPLLISTTNPEAMEVGLKLCNKRAVINSASGMEESKEKIFPLAVKYPVDVIVGLYNEQGAPPNADERAILALELVEYANNLGISSENIWIDPMVYPVSTNQDQVVACIEFIQMIDDVVPGAKIITGVSNVSSGVAPKELREILNRTFFVILRRHNQYAGIVNVRDKELVRLDRGELPQLAQLVHRAMDEEYTDEASLASEEAAYMKATNFILGRKPYSRSAFKGF